MQKNRNLRGSDQKCPKCGSSKVTVSETLEYEGYGPGLATCENCRCLWEYFTESMIWAPEEPFSSFKEPCNNCAFRKGSPEQEDKEEWGKLLQTLALSGSFYCHKGVPIEPDAEHGFAYPHKDGVPVTRKLRICRGYLNFLFGKKAEEIRTQKGTK